MCKYSRTICLIGCSLPHSQLLCGVSFPQENIPAHLFSRVVPVISLPVAVVHSPVTWTSSVANTRIEYPFSCMSARFEWRPICREFSQRMTSIEHERSFNNSVMIHFFTARYKSTAVLMSHCRALTLLLTVRWSVGCLAL